MASTSVAHPTSPDDFPSPSDTEALYARIVSEIRDSGLSTADIARLVGVAERQVRNWTSGGSTPSGRNRDRLLELHYVTQALRDLYTREGAEIWLHGRNAASRAVAPVDMLAERLLRGGARRHRAQSAGAM